jgi:hypothetical protein
VIFAVYVVIEFVVFGIESVDPALKNIVPGITASTGALLRRSMAKKRVGIGAVVDVFDASAGKILVVCNTL